MELNAKVLVWIRLTGPILLASDRQETRLSISLNKVKVKLYRM